jgi:hypothetical protein
MEGTIISAASLYLDPTLELFANLVKNTIVTWSFALEELWQSRRE